MITAMARHQGGSSFARLKHPGLSPSTLLFKSDLNNQTAPPSSIPGASTQGVSGQAAVGTANSNFSAVSAPYLKSFSPFAPPAFNPAFHQERRQALLAQLPPKSLVIVMGGEEIRRNNDVNYPFRQQNDFYYLTGFAEPNAMAILQKDETISRMTLLVNPKDPSKEVWTGRRAGVEGAKAIYGAQDAYPNSMTQKVLEDKIALAQASGARVFFIPAESHETEASRNKPISDWSEGVSQTLKTLRGALPIEDGLPFVRELRLVKTPYEIALLKRACEISATAHRKAMKTQKLPVLTSKHPQ
ncbi:MAG: aminopeptidase P N-terminal domain-containing protein, partial [Cyanobacteria bacterium]|nr:aminopeptidase P N-terminal domain-containing protein [Cyanobacteriota bacterium]